MHPEKFYHTGGVGLWWLQNGEFHAREIRQPGLM